MATEHIILTLPTTGTGDENIPTIPGATNVSRQTDTMYIAYGDFVPGTNTKWMRGHDQVVAYLYEWKTGEFVVVGEKAALNAIDPTNKGTTADTMGVEFDAHHDPGAIGGIDFGITMGTKSVVAMEI